MGSEPPPPPRSDAPGAEDPPASGADAGVSPLDEIPIADPAFAIDAALLGAPSELPQPTPSEAPRDTTADAMPPHAPPDPPPTPPADAELAVVPAAPVPSSTDAARPQALQRVKHALTGAWSAATEATTRLTSAGLKYFLPYILAASGAGSALWFARNPTRLPDALTNKLPKKEQFEILRYVLVSLGSLVALTLVAIAVLRLVQKRFSVLRTARFSSAWSFVVCGAAFGTGLAVPSVESAHPALTLLLAAACSACVGAAVYRGTVDPSALDVSPRAGAEHRVSPTRERLIKAAVVAALVAGWAGYAIIFTRLAIQNHVGLATRVTDLGIYDNIFWQSAHGFPLKCTFIKAEYHGSAHFDPLLVVLSPLYLIYPRAEFLLGFQSVWLGSAIVPMYLLGRSANLGRFASLVVAFCFLLHPALHGANLYEFHSLTLANPVLLWVLYTLDRGRLRWYFPVLGVCLLIREDMSLLMVFVSIAAMLRYDGPRRRAAVATLFVAMAYFVFVKLVFMSTLDVFNNGGGPEESYGFAYYYQDLNQSEAKGFLGFILSIVTNPVFVVSHALQEVKLIFLLTMFLPVVFLPAISRKGRLMLVYGAVFILLASRAPVFTVHFQYTSTFLPIIFALVPDAIARVRDSQVLKGRGWSTPRLARAAVAAMFVATALVSLKFGGILDNTSFRGGFIRPVRKLSAEDRKTFAWVDETIAMIPQEASVASSDKMGAHISNRGRAYFYKVVVTEPGPPPKYATAKPFDYVFLDEKDMKDPEATFFKQDLACGALQEVARRGTLVLMKSAPRGPTCTQ